MTAVSQALQPSPAVLPRAAFAIRTGEQTPYANVVLRCGVPF